jgi:hypothetical protein
MPQTSFLLPQGIYQLAIYGSPLSGGCAGLRVLQDNVQVFQWDTSVLASGLNSYCIVTGAFDLPIGAQSATLTIAVGQEPSGAASVSLLGPVYLMITKLQ